MAIHNIIGSLGENYAAQLMEKKGNKVIERNWRMGHLEMDIICENKKEVIFVEVKTRTSTFANVMPEQYVDILKKRRMIAAANGYMKYTGLESKKQIRFDIIGILVNKDQTIADVHHYENAFYPHARTITSSSYSGQWRWKHRTKRIGR